MEPITIYFLLAIAFSIATLFTVHLSSIRKDMPRFWLIATFGSLSWLATSAILFPFILSAMVTNWDVFIEGYKEGLYDEED